MDGIVESDSVEILSPNGVCSSVENIQNRSYPVVVRFYAIYIQTMMTKISWL